MSAYVFEVILAVMLVAVVLVLVADHRRGWLTETLVGNHRASQRTGAPPQGYSSRRRLNPERAPAPEARGSAGD